MNDSGTLTKMAEQVAEHLIAERAIGEQMEGPKTDEATFRRATIDRFKEIKKVYLRCMYMVSKMNERLIELTDTIDSMAETQNKMSDLLEENGIADRMSGYATRTEEIAQHTTKSLPIGTVVSSCADDKAIVSCQACLWGIEQMNKKGSMTGHICSNSECGFHKQVTALGKVRRCAYWENYEAESFKRPSGYGSIAGYDFSDGAK